jgi:hypothetical protein
MAQDAAVSRRPGSEELFGAEARRELVTMQQARALYAA